MKQKFLTVLAVALVMTTASFAQGFHVGIKGGANLMKIDDKSFKDEFKFGYNLGAFATVNFSKKVGIQPELLWSQSNYQTATDIDQVIPNSQNSKDVKLNYLQIPVLLNLSPSKLFTFQVGPQFGILINDSKTLLNNGQEAFAKGDFSMLGGAQLNLGGIKAGARYAVGLNDIGDISQQTSWKSRGWQLYVGLNLF